MTHNLSDVVSSRTFVHNILQQEMSLSFCVVYQHLVSERTFGVRYNSNTCIKLFIMSIIKITNLVGNLLVLV